MHTEFHANHAALLWRNVIKTFEHNSVCDDLYHVHLHGSYFAAFLLLTGTPTMLKQAQFYMYDDFTIIVHT